MQKKLKINLIIVFSILFCFGNIEAVTLKDIQKRYMSHTDFITSFSQNTYQIIVNKEILFTGNLYYKRDYGVRMDVFTPQRQIIILKEGTVQIYLPDEGTTNTQEIPKEIATQNILGFFSGLNSLEKDYVINETNQGLRLSPKNGTGSIEVWVDGSNLLSRIQLIDATGNQSEIRLKDYSFNQNLTEDLFQLESVTKSKKTDHNKKQN